MDTPLLSLVRNKIIEYTRYTSQEIIGVYINETVHAVTETYGNEIADVLFAQDQYIKKYNNPDELVVKSNHYNLMMHNRRRKYKIWLGVNAKVAEANHKIALKTWPLHYTVKNTRTFKGDGYYIESIPFIDGFTLRDVFSKPDYRALDQIRNIESITNLVAQFVSEFYTEDYKNQTICCLDLLPDNLVLPDNSSKLVLIDFDHIVHVNRNYMLDTISNRFFEYPFTYDDISCHPWWLEWRNTHSNEETVSILRSKLK